VLRPIGFALATLLLCSAAACVEDHETSDETAPVEAPAATAGKADGVGYDDALWTEIAERCGAPAADEQVLFSNDFHWGYSREEMASDFDEVYASGKRLADRAFYDAENDRFLLRTSDAWGSWVTMPKRIVENVSRHIEGALERGYVEHVFFPDMGHSHFFVPQAHWDASYAGGEVSELADRYTRLLDDPRLLVLYHTAEQLQMLDDDDQLLPDPWLQWRFHTRSMVGDNDGHGRLELLRDFENKANTSRDYPGHHYLGAGFSISASEQGCFPYEHDGERRWYDLSLSDLPYQPTGDEGGGL
jgi:hypothetical protein